MWAESTIGNWIVITRLASSHHWGCRAFQRAVSLAWWEGVEIQ